MKLTEGYTNDLKVAARANSTAYGYSILISMSALVVNSIEGTPEVYEVMLAAAGAVIGFVLVEGISTRGFRDRGRGERPDVVLLGSAMRFLSVGLGVGVAAAIASVLSSWLAWLAATMAATAVYIAVEALELSGARAIREPTGDA